MAQPKNSWTDADFETISWHDNYVHAFRFVEGEHGTGTLTLDIDFITQWIKSERGFSFLIAPADLTFRDVWALRISLDYHSCAMGPFSIMGIEHRSEKRERYVAQIWDIEVTFPNGHITFEATGFEQNLRKQPRRVDRQWLTPEERDG